MIAEDEEIEEEKVCEQCKLPKRLSAFHRSNNKTDGRMRMCIECYRANLEENKQRQQEWRQEWERQRAEEKNRQAEESQRIRAAIPELVRSLCSGNTQICEDCKQEFLIDNHGCLVVPRIPPEICPKCGEPIFVEYHAEGNWVSYRCQGHIGASCTIYEGRSTRYCPTCHEARRMKNRQVYPFCPMCNTPTQVYDFLHWYRGFRLDLIKVCCERCIPHFEALPEAEQLERLRRAMVKAYGDAAVIYALQYDDQAPCHHIGRTKHYNRRMAEYKRNWDRDIQHHFVLQQLAFGALSMEYESRWMMHALKCGWPIDNFELLKIGDEALGGINRQAQLAEIVQGFDPLTAPFEVIQPLLRQYFSNTSDAAIANWYCSHYARGAYPDEQGILQRLALLECLHGLKR